MPEIRSELDILLETNPSTLAKILKNTDTTRISETTLRYVLRTEDVLEHLFASGEVGILDCEIPLWNTILGELGYRLRIKDLSNIINKDLHLWNHTSKAGVPACDVQLEKL